MVAGRGVAGWCAGLRGGGKGGNGAVAKQPGEGGKRSYGMGEGRRLGRSGRAEVRNGRGTQRRNLDCGLAGLKFAPFSRKSAMPVSLGEALARLRELRVAQARDSELVAELCSVALANSGKLGDEGLDVMEQVGVCLGWDGGVGCGGMLTLCAVSAGRVGGARHQQRHPGYGKSLVGRGGGSGVEAGRQVGLG